MLFLNVPYAEKDMAKTLGAKWNPKRKQWSVFSRKDYYKFSRWFTKDESPSIPETSFILIDYFYLLEGVRKCWKCGEKTKLVGFGFGPYIKLEAYEFCDETADGFILDETITDFPLEICNDEEIHIAEGLYPWPKELLDFLKTNYNYYKSFSKTLQSDCYANHCQACNSLQGNFFLYHEPDSPFWVDTIEDAMALKLYKVKLPYDIATLDYPAYGYPTDELLYKFTPKYSAPNIFSI